MEKKRPISNIYIRFLWKNRPISIFYTGYCGKISIYFKYLHAFSVEKNDLFQISTYPIVEKRRPISNIYIDVFQISISKTALVENKFSRNVFRLGVEESESSRMRKRVKWLGSETNYFGEIWLSSSTFRHSLRNLKVLFMLDN